MEFYFRLLGGALFWLSITWSGALYGEPTFEDKRLVVSQPKHSDPGFGGVALSNLDSSKGHLKTPPQEKLETSQPEKLESSQSEKLAMPPQDLPSSFLKSNQRVVVFPLNFDFIFEKKERYEAWWAVQKTLTQRSSLWVASKSFLERVGVFKPRSELDLSGVVMLSNLLEADILVTLFYRSRTRTLHMNVYGGGVGLLLWSDFIEAHPSFLLHEQLEDMSKTLTNRFLTQLPYDGSIVGKNALSSHKVMSKGFNKYIYIQPVRPKQFSVNQEVILFSIKPTYKAQVFSNRGHEKVNVIRGLVVEAREDYTPSQVRLVDVGAQELEQLEKESFFFVFDKSFSQESKMVSLPDSHELYREEKTKKNDRKTAFLTSLGYFFIFLAILL